MKFNESANVNYLWAELIVEELTRNGITAFCIAPGSRSSPLTLAAAASDKVDKIVHFDERGLAYFALGMVSANKEPVALISTSGTAVANFLPAVIEASKKKIPIVLLTADRPPELRKTGALQTIDQPGIYGKYVRWEFDLPVPDMKIQPEMVLTTVDQAVFMSKYPMPGPVHLNCMFREPLAPEKTDKDSIKNLKIKKMWVNGNSPYTEYFSPDEKISAPDADKIAEVVTNVENGIIAVGKLRGKNDEGLVVKLAEKLGWPIFPDLTSGLRSRKLSENIIHYFDRLLLSDISGLGNVGGVIHIGGRMTSKRFYEFLKRNTPPVYITVLNHPLRNDPFHLVSHRVKSTVQNFVESILPKLSGTGETRFPKELKKISNGISDEVEKFVKSRKKLDEIHIARCISRTIKSGSALFLSNSMPIRDMDMYFIPGSKDLMFGGNRGASGIDGVVASACGFGYSSERPLTLVIGDLAFLHDINSLALVKNCKKQIIIIVINNNGGTIFSFLPVSEYKTHFEKYFTTPHGMNFKNIAEQFGINYKKIVTKEEFTEEYESAVLETENVILEVNVDMETNVKAHKELDQLIEKSINL